MGILQIHAGLLLYSALYGFFAALANSEYANSLLELFFYFVACTVLAYIPLALLVGLFAIFTAL